MNLRILGGKGQGFAVVLRRCRRQLPPLGEVAQINGEAGFLTPLMEFVCSPQERLGTGPVPGLEEGDSQFSFRTSPGGR